MLPFSHMRAIVLLAFISAALPCTGQQAAPQPGLPSDPHAILDAARPLYDFSASDLKPWHFKATYQLYGENETPTETGTFEYWWAAPDTWRTSWTRSNASYTYWQLPGRNSAHSGSADVLSYAESKLKSALLSPLPSERTVNAGNTQLEKRAYGKDTGALQCVMVGIKMEETSTAPIGLFPTYCFMAQKPVLAAYFAFAAPIIEFNQIVKVQNRYFPKQVTILSDQKKKLLTATLDSVNGIPPGDAALTPPADANGVTPTQVAVIKEKNSGNADSESKSSAVPIAAPTDGKTITIAGGIAQGMILKKVPPIYPADAKADHISGTVVIEALIGTDGWIHDMHVTQAPSASLAASSLGAVSQWHYRPYLLNGEPVEVQTTVNVIYALSY